MKMICLALAFVLHTNLVKAEDDIPEKIVEISVKPLVVSKKVVRARLPKDYAEQVVRAISEKKPLLQDCLKDSQNQRYELKTELHIASNGSASVQTEEKKDAPKTEVDCVLKVLKEIQYPSHELKSVVKVNLPVILKKDTI